MTLVLRSATLTDVSDRTARLLGLIGLQSAAAISDAWSASNGRLIGFSGGGSGFMGSVPEIYDQSVYNRLRGDVGGMLYQKPLPVPVRRSPRRILFTDDVEATALKWSQNAGTLTRTTTAGEFWDGIAAMKAVTGAAAGNAAGAIKTWAYQGLQKYVIELWWAMSAAAATTPRFFGIDLTLNDGTNDHEITVAYVKNVTTPQNKWQFGVAFATMADITGGAETLPVQAAVPLSWHYLRVHIDASGANPTLTELHTDTLDLTGLTHAGGTAGASSRINSLLIQGYTDVAAASTFYFDDIVVSDSEV